jgi:hypothetical protein
VVPTVASVPVEYTEPVPTRRYRTWGITTEKFTVAAAVRLLAPVVYVEAAKAASGSVNTAVPNKVFNAIDMFINCILCCAIVGA